MIARAMPSPWLAVEAGTDLLAHAREIQRSWERLVVGGALEPELPPRATAGMRPMIVESWRRTLATGLDPTDLLAPIEAEEPEVRERWLEHPLGSAARVLAAQLRAVAEETHSLVVVTDASGLLLHVDGADWLKDRAREMNLLAGARYSEMTDGTNGIGTALAADHPLQVFAFEHFNQRHHDWICSGAPVHDPMSGRIVGLIDLSSLWKIAHPRSLELVTTAAKTVERVLSDIQRDQDSRLRRRYSDLMTRSTDLLVNRSGYVLDAHEPTRAKPLDVPESGGEIVMDDGSLAVAEPLGHGEAYLVRRLAPAARRRVDISATRRAENHLRELAEEQAALRQIATLVAHESSPDRLAAAVAEQVARIFAVPLVRLIRYEPAAAVVIGSFSESDDAPFPVGSRWRLDTPGLLATIRHTGQAARVEDYAQTPGDGADVARAAGMRSALGSPIVVGGRVWGAIVLLSPRRAALPEDTAARLADFTELVATAIANAGARDELSRLVQEQAALRRVAMLVAEGAGSDELFAAVTTEAADVLDVPVVALQRYEPDRMFTMVAIAGETTFMVGSRWPVEDEGLAGMILATGRPARRQEYTTMPGPLGAALRAGGMVSAVGVPVVVDGSIWGFMTAGARPGRPIPDGTEERLARFTELVATAIADSQAREQLAQLAYEQTALRRVATMVASAPASEQLFSTVAREVASVLRVPGVIVTRYEPDGTAVTVGQAFGPELAGAEQFLGIGTPMPPDPGTLTALVLDTHRPARVDDLSTAPGIVGEVSRAAELGSGCAGPIVVNGAVWGKMCVFSRVGTVLPAGTENRLRDFIDLVATAIANYEARAELAASEARAGELADEQAALRRVATLVARGVSPGEIFSAVTNEMAQLFGSPQACVGRFEPDGSAMVVVGVSDGTRGISIGSRWELQDYMASTGVYRTGRPVRVERSELEHVSGPMADVLREIGAVSNVGAPIVVEGKHWGFVTVTDVNKRLPADAEKRLEKFAELLGTAIANADSRAQLAASRARIVAAGDDARRRIERDLHDGAQQRLVTLAIALRRAEAKVPVGSDELLAEIRQVADGLKTAVDGLRELSQGIHPAELTAGGLSPALKALGRRSAIRVELDVPFEDRLPDQVEVAAYYTVSEALTNASKHASGTRVWVSLGIEDDVLRLSIRDDGVGGADPRRGSGLTGLRDRIEALGGRIRIESQTGSGTLIEVEIPITGPADRTREPDELLANAAGSGSSG
jgi:signal transduction histidine kinase